MTGKKGAVQPRDDREKVAVQPRDDRKKVAVQPRDDRGKKVFGGMTIKENISADGRYIGSGFVILSIYLLFIC